MSRVRLVLSGNHLGDGLEAMRLVARIDALGRIADGEIAAGDEAGGPLEDRHAILFRGAGVDRRFVDDDIGLLQRPPDRLRGADEGGEVRSARLVERGRDGDDEEVGTGDLGRIRGQAQSRVGEVVRLDLAGTIMAGLELGDTAGVDIEADDRRTLPRKGDGDRQTDIAEPDDGELSTVRHE